MNYKLVINPYTQKEQGVYLNGNTSNFIPFDPDNTDYQAYLKWVAEGNTPEAAE